MADCVDAGIPTDRLRHVPLGVRAERAPAADVARVKHAYRLDRYILWNGTVEPRKNLGALLAAFRQLLDLPVQLVLVGPDGWREDVDSRLDGVRERVTRLRFQPVANLRALHAGAAVFCYPSTREGFGLPVLEAMAQGTPVVTSTGTATEEVARAAGLVVDPADPEAIAAALRRVLTDDALAASLRDAGLARAAEYTWERTAAATAAAYRELAG
jgi:glycosyltransferase involved in cell wall biosynthesis